MTAPRTPSPRICKAAQIIAEQRGCDEDEAMTRLRERAESLLYRPYNYALLVIEGIVRFDE
jgi:hypothetical protein